MSKERIEIGTVVEVADAKRSINELRQSILDSKTALQGLNAGTEEYNEEIKSLVTAQSQLIGLQNGLKDSFKDIDGTTSTLNTNMNATISSIGGMLGGFQALQGVLALVGKENKDVASTLVKLQAVNNVAQGFKQFTDAIRATNMAFRIFNITVRSNPLVMLGTALVSTIALIKSLGQETEDTTSSIGTSIDVLSTKLDGMKDFNADKEFKRRSDLAVKRIEEEIKLMQLQGKTEKQINKYREKSYGKLKEDTQAELSETLKKLEEIIKVIGESEKAIDKMSEGSTKELAKSNLKYRKELAEGYSETSEKLRDRLVNIRAIEDDFTFQSRKATINEEKKKEAIRVEYNRKRLAEQNKLNNDLEKAELSNDKAKTNRTNISQQRAIEETTAFTETRLELYRALEDRTKEVEDSIEDFESQLKELDKKETKTTQDRINKLKEETSLIESLTLAEQEKFNLDKETFALHQERLGFEEAIEQVGLDSANREARAKLMLENSGKYNTNLKAEINLNKELLEVNENIKQSNKDIFEDEERSWEERLQAIVRYNEVNLESYALKSDIVEAELELEERKREAVQATLQITGNALMAASEHMKQGTAIQKALAKTGTAISTIAAAQNVFESTAKIPFVGKILAPIAAASALAQGAKRIREINKIKIPGGDKGASGGTLPQPQILQAMPNVQQTVTKMDGDDLDVINKDTKVYVVESDISKQQNRVKVAESEASF